MSAPFRTPEDYELFLYTITERFPAVQRSSLIFVRRGSTLGRVSGELHFAHGFRLVLRERVLFSRLPIVTDWYGYEVWKDDEKLYWYDSQPHPNNAELAGTHPHHKHIPPNIKRNRIPAPNMSFEQPNLPALIEEIEELIASEEVE